jgi:hypothetical protein
VSIGRLGDEGLTNLGVPKDVRFAANAEVLLARAKGVMVKSGRDLAVVKVEGFGRGDNVEGKAAQNGGILEKGSLLMRGEGVEEMGVADFDDFSDTRALRFERDTVVGGEVEKGNKDMGSRLDSSCSSLGSDFGKEEPTKSSEAGGKGDNVFLGRSSL